MKSNYHYTKFYRVCQASKFIDQRKKEHEFQQGQLINIEQFNFTIDYLDELICRGILCDPMESASQIEITIAPPMTKTKRVGIWLSTSKWYSGGRIHIYQYAHSLALNGHEVFLITDDQPRWISDYPACRSIRIIINGKSKIPEDLDLIVTDSKNNLGAQAKYYKDRHKNIPFICFNFETPNWVKEYVPDYAERLHSPKEIFQAADYYIANSRLSAKYLKEWLEKPNACCFVIPPAVNDYMINKTVSYNRPKRPYIVWSSRSASYKGSQLVVDSIFSLPFPMDLVTFSDIKHIKYNRDHQVLIYKGVEDKIKYDLYKNAKVILAPSLFEGYGMVPGEALSTGTPCIVYDLPVLRQEYGEWDGLHYIEWDNKSKFKAKVKDILSNPKKEACRTILQSHSMGAMRKTLESLPLHSFERPSISAQLICYWGLLTQSIESIYPYVDEINVAFGPVEHAEQINDGSLAKLQSYPDPEHKIKIEIRENWKNKQEMRQWCSNQSTGNYNLVLDGDEIWVGFESLLNNIPFIYTPPWINFWHDSNHWVHGGRNRWGDKLNPYGSRCPHYRFSWWRKSYSWKKHHALPCDASGEYLINKTDMIIPGCYIYHLGHALSKEVMEKKHSFYLDRDGHDKSRQQRQDAWHNWDGSLGKCGDGIIEFVTWEKPKIIERAFQELLEIKPKKRRRKK